MTDTIEDIITNENCIIIPEWTMLVAGVIIGVIVGSLLTAGIYIIFYRISDKTFIENNCDSHSDEIYVGKSNDEMMSEITFTQYLGQSKRMLELIENKKDNKQPNPNPKKLQKNAKGKNNHDFTQKLKMDQFLKQQSRRFGRKFLGKHPNHDKNIAKAHESATKLRKKNVDVDTDIEEAKNNEDKSLDEFVVDVDTINGDGASVLTFSDIIKSRDLKQYYNDWNSDRKSNNTNEKFGGFHQKDVSNSRNETNTKKGDIDVIHTPQTVSTQEDYIYDNETSINNRLIMERFFER